MCKPSLSTHFARLEGALLSRSDSGCPFPGSDSPRYQLTRQSYITCGSYVSTLVARGQKPVTVDVPRSPSCWTHSFHLVEC